MKIGVLFAVTEEQQAQLKFAANGNQIEFLDKHTRGSVLESYEVLIGFPDPGILQDAVSLRYLQLTTAGANRYLNLPQFKDGKILLATASGAYGCGVSEWMLSMTMMMFKKLYLYRDNMSLASKRWSSHGKVKAINGSTIVCFGTGDIGTEYAKRVKALGAHVIGICRSKEKTHSSVFDEIYTSKECHPVLQYADAVAMALPSTQESFHLLSKELLAEMQSDAYLINAGRGDTVDTAALIEALQNGSIAGAALDVTDPEPLPDASPLWNFSNVMITPHVAGGFNLDLTKAQIVSAAAQNLSLYVKGELPQHIVDFALGY